MKFYYTDASPPCRTILLLAELLHIKLELIVTSPKKGETNTAAFLEMNPQHVVPTLVDDDGYIVWESRVIAKYLIGKYAKDDSLYPSDFYKRIEVDKILDFDLGTIFRRITDYCVTLIINGKLDPSKKPKVDDAMKVLDTFIGRSKAGFVAADQLTIADISILTTVTSLQALNYDWSIYTNVIRWMTKIKNAIPNYETLGVKGENAFKELAKSAMK